MDLSYTPEQQAFRAEVRAYLLENPEVLVEALDILQTRQAEAAALAYLQALQAMTRAEAAGEHLFLTGPEGRVLEFARDPGDNLCFTCGD